MSFYVTLPSNASAEIFPNNTISHYMTKLPKELNFQNESWLVGLSEIHVPGTIPNVDSTNDSFSIEYPELTENEHLPAIHQPLYVVKPTERTYHNISDLIYDLNIAIFHETNEALVEPLIYNEMTNSLDINCDPEFEISFTNRQADSLATHLGLTPKHPNRFQQIRSLKPLNFRQYRYSSSDNVILIKQIKKRVTKKAISKILKIDPGYYRSFNHLIQAIVLALPYSQRNNILMTLNADNTINITLKNGLKIQFSEDMCGMLGLGTTDAIVQNYRGKYKFDLNRGTTSIFCYTNLITPQIIGDTFAPLIKILPIKRSEGQNLVVHKFQRVDYFPILTERVETIEILLADETGTPIKFETGRVICILHFIREEKI